MQTFDFAIGTHVYCQDGECGKLTRVVVDPNTLEMKELVVEKGVLFKKARVLPMTIVASASVEEIQLAIHQDELENFPPYTEEEYQVITDVDTRWPAYQEVLPNELALQMMSNPDLQTRIDAPLLQEKIYQNPIDHLAVLKRGTPIYTLDGEVGKLDRVITDSNSEQITHIIVRQGVLFVEYLPVPVSLVQEVRKNGIHLATYREGLSGLKQINWSENRHSSYRDKVYEQKISAGMTKEADILSEELALRAVVANTISEDPQTKNAVIEVINEHGVITLVGTVANGKTREAAEEIAAAHEGVISVINALKVYHDDGPGSRNRSEHAGGKFHPIVHPPLVDQ